MYEKWYFHGRYKNCICIADADDLDFSPDSLDLGYSLVLELVISLYRVPSTRCRVPRYLNLVPDAEYLVPAAEYLAVPAGNLVVVWVHL